MTKATDESVLEALLDSYHRGNTILLNLLRALPENGLDAKAMEGSTSVAQMFSHIHQMRLFWLTQTAPEFAENLTPLLSEERIPERDPEGIEQALNQSTKAVCDAVKSHLESGEAMKLRPPGFAPPAHALARGLSFRSDEAGTQGCRTRVERRARGKACLEVMAGGSLVNL